MTCFSNGLRYPDNYCLEIMHHKTNNLYNAEERVTRIAIPTLRIDELTNLYFLDS